MEEKNKWRECREIDFPTLLKRTREELGLTQSEFGRGFGVGLTTVSMWENGKRKVGKDVVEFLVSKELDRAREEVEKKFREKRKKREEEMNVPYSEEDGKEFWQGYQEGYNQGLHDMIIDTYYLDKEFQSKLTTK